MAKRFTDTDLWKSQRWFRKLKPIYKLVFCYVKDQCNHAGIWKIDVSDMIEDLGLDEINFEDFVSCVNVEYDKITGKKIFKERLKIVKKNFLWLTGFIQFQYEGKDNKVNWEAAPVRTALMHLEGLATLKEGLHKSYIVLHQPLSESWTRPKDKDKDKDKMYLGNKKKIDKNICGKEFSRDGLYVVLEDGEKQILGKNQKLQLKHESILPKDIYKNYIV